MDSNLNSDFILVSTLEDENDGDFSAGDLSLREAIAIADTGDTINFDPNLSGGSISLSLLDLAVDLNLAELAIPKELGIQGLRIENVPIDGSLFGGEFPEPIITGVFDLNAVEQNTVPKVTLAGITVIDEDETPTATDDDILENLTLNIRIVGTPNDDLLSGTEGSDTIKGLAGNDTLEGLDAADVLLGENGNDFLDGGARDDSLHGSAGEDTLLGGNGQDTLNGGIGRDLLEGGASDDQLFGQNGNDTLLGETGRDTLNGGFGNDSLDGGTSDDLLLGFEGDDTLDGGNGRDTLDGGIGNDLITGGNSNDTFVLSSGAGTDIITDFGRGNNVIALGNGITFAELSLVGNDIILGTETLATLNGFDATTLSESDFVSI